MRRWRTGGSRGRAPAAWRRPPPRPPPAAGAAPKSAGSRARSSPPSARRWRAPPAALPVGSLVRIASWRYPRPGRTGRPSRAARPAPRLSGALLGLLPFLRGARLARLDLLPERGLARDRQVGLEELIGLLADALDQHQVLGRLEGAVLLAEIEDPLGHGRPDPRQKRELRGIGGVDVDHPAGLRGEGGKGGEDEPRQDQAADKTTGTVHDVLLRIWLISCCASFD